MADESSDATVVSEAYAAARDLLRLAEAEAAEVRAGAERYARQREQEAELLVGKARRLLEIAEGQAAAITSASARGAEPPPPRHLRPDDPTAIPAPADGAAPLRIDLDAVAVDGAPARSAAAPASRLSNDLDRLLADAIAKAVDRSFSHDA